MMNSFILIAALFLSATSAEDLPVGLIMEGCPSGLSSPAQDFTMADVLGKWYIHSVANLPFLRLQHGECLTANFVETEDAYGVVAYYIHEGAPITISTDIYMDGPGQLTFYLADNTNPAIIVDVVADSHFLFYTCENDLLDDARGFGQLYLLTKDRDAEVEDILDLSSIDINGYTWPEMSRVHQGEDCFYPESF